MVALLYISIALAFACALALTLNPVAGILALTLTKPIIDTAFYAPLVFGLTLTQMFGATVPMIMFGHMFAQGGRNAVRFMPMRMTWMVYMGYAFIFSLIIVYQEGVQNGLDVFFRHTNGFVGFYMLQAFFRDDRRLRQLVTMFLLAGVFPIVTTFYQIVTGVQWHQHLAHMESEGFTRSSGLYYHILTVRYYVYQTLIGILLYWSMVYRPRVWLKMIGVVLGLLALVVLYRTYSKAGYLTIGLWMILWGVIQKKYVFLALLMLSLLVVMPFFASDLGDVVYQVFHKEVAALEGEKTGEAAFSGRIYAWERMLDEQSKLGVFAQVFGSGHMMIGAHNDYIMMLFHGGLIGFLIYLFLLASAGWRVVSELRRRVDPLGVAALMVYLAFLIDTVGLTPSSYPHFQWLVWGVIGLSLRRGHDSATKFASEQAPAVPKLESVRPRNPTRKR
jgi:O-Antigen ligase